MSAIEFLTVADVIAAHEEQLARYGGDSGLRDVGLLESAVAQASATFGGNYLHQFPSGMAAAYMFHVVRNHPFVDGNKRTGVVAALVFLDWNGYDVVAPKGAVYDITFAVASDQKQKPDVEAWFQEHTQRRE